MTAIVTENRTSCKDTAVGGPAGSAAQVAPAAVRRTAALWTFGFRPFFFAAGLWSATAIVVWVVMLTTGATLPSRFDPLRWHIHEMLFGFVPAAIAGFMLTAIPNWTGRKPIRGAPLAALAILWLLGRVACLASARMPLALAAAVDLAFPFALCVVAAHEIIAARNWRNLAMPLPIAVLTVADALMYLSAAGAAVPSDLGWRLGIAAIVILISAVAGRIVPSFTRNWLKQRGNARGPATHRLVDRIGLAVLHAGLVGWAVAPSYRPVGWLLAAGALLGLYRLSGWRGLQTVKEPLLVVLHVGYAWLMVGVVLLAASLLGSAVPIGAAIHALTAGAIGTMVLAVMTRVSLGHTGRPLRADRTTTAIYLLVGLAAAARIAAGIADEAFLPLVMISGALWVGSFALFVIHYGPMLLMPRHDAARAGGAARP